MKVRMTNFAIRKAASRKVSPDSITAAVEAGLVPNPDRPGQMMAQANNLRLVGAVDNNEFTIVTVYCD